MARRSDHSRAELRKLFIEKGHRHLAEQGYANFSARAVARKVGYSIGTLYNVFGSLDGLIIAINSRSFALWADFLEARLDGMAETGRIAALVEGYFDFAAQNRNIWRAIYEHDLPDEQRLGKEGLSMSARLTGLIGAEIQRALPESDPEKLRQLTRSLIALVHGHCSFELDGSFRLMNIDNGRQLALIRVQEALDNARP